MSPLNVERMGLGRLAVTLAFGFPDLGIVSRLFSIPRFSSASMTINTCSTLATALPRMPASLSSTVPLRKASGGADLCSDFIDLGSALFLDMETLKTNLLTANVTDPESALKQSDGQIDIVYVGSFFHLFWLSG